MSLVHLRDLGVPRTLPQERTGIFRLRISGLGKHGEWQETKGNHSNTPIHLPIEQTPQTGGMDRHGSSTSAPLTPQKTVPIENGKQDVEPCLKLGRT
ncbi:hypothetical protein O181_026131 [Austropuccinia psidii MF-1]|uniref:Uncharacterized protein n=1 Tax=Austropuccinia psidii MF-1 TaxID=1389203 RepID=A0A9Q3H077_9BASI|nr:hypothetical protein [Austropuccinia psidii MF-1]